MSINFKPGTTPGETVEEGGITWEWDGQKWNRITTENAGESFLKKRGDIVDDAQANVVYQWNQDLTIQTDNKDILIKGEDLVKVEAFGNVDIEAENDDVKITANHNADIKAFSQVNINAVNNDVVLKSDNGAERVNRTITSSSIDDQIVNKRYVDSEVTFLQSEVVELEQEIEGIAITSERGEWISATSLNPGEFRMVNLQGQTTQDYSDETIVSIFFNNNDAQDPSVEHGWGDVEVGNILELLDKPDLDYAIYEIISINPGTGTMEFNVSFIKGVGEAALGDRTRIKIFAKPTGGNLEDYVRIEGDTMTGALTIDLEQPTNNPANSFRIYGMIKPDPTSPPEKSLLLKDFRREQGSTSNDYIAYYGSGGGDNGLVNLGMLSDYLKRVDLSTSRNGTTVTINNTAGNNTTIDGATNSNAGTVTTGGQTWAGNKTFEGVVNLKNKLQINGTTTNSRYLGTNGTGNLEWKQITKVTDYVKNENYNASNANSVIKISKTNNTYYITGG